jgi:hypothetical protein
LELVEKTRQTVREQFSAWEEVYWVASETNLGCGKRISSGLSEIFSKEERLIILEDDCLPERSFFRFCDELLEYYQDNALVGSISGSRFTSRCARPEDSYYFSRYSHIWGWASWRRAWVAYDFGLSRWRDTFNEAHIARATGSRRAARKLGQLLDRVKSGEIDTWDYQLTAAFLEHGQLSIHPMQNLVSNIGFGVGATHTEDADSQWSKMKTQPIGYPLRHPKTLCADTVADKQSGHLLFPNTSFWGKLMTRLRSL